jgi:hypothetical protein
MLYQVSKMSTCVSPFVSCLRISKEYICKAKIKCFMRLPTQLLFFVCSDMECHISSKEVGYDNYNQVWGI